MRTDFDIIIAGGGLVGLTAALALSQNNIKTAVIDARRIGESLDPRASTLAASSYAMMKNLGLGEKLEAQLQPVNNILIGEGRPGDISPLTLHFDGAARQTPMAYMIENESLKSALSEAARAAENLTLIEAAPITEFTAAHSHSLITLASGKTLTAQLAIAADGRESRLRKSAQIPCAVTHYDQSAIVTTVRHERPHDGIAQQLFLTGGPFAILPLRGDGGNQKRASIVWSDSTSAIEAAMALDEASFHAELSRRFGEYLGAITLDGPKLSYPLKLQMAERYTALRLALIGDAAHAVHPLAGQGLNMGLRDAAALTDIILSARAAGLDIGGAELERYSEWRRADNRMIAAATDGLNRLFSNSVLPLRHIRRLGLAAVNSLPQLGVVFMAEAAGETGDLPPLLRG